MGSVSSKRYCWAMEWALTCELPACTEAQEGYQNKHSYRSCMCWHRTATRTAEPKHRHSTSTLEPLHPLTDSALLLLQLCLAVRNILEKLGKWEYSLSFCREKVWHTRFLSLKNLSSVRRCRKSQSSKNPSCTEERKFSFFSPNNNKKPKQTRNSMFLQWKSPYRQEVPEDEF